MVYETNEMVGAADDGCTVAGDGTGSLIKLVGDVDRASAVVIDGGNYRAQGTYVHDEGFFEKFPTSMFEVEAPVGTVKPTITLLDGKVSCATLNGSAGPFLSGDACALTILGGEYSVDPQAYLAQGAVSYAAYGGYTVLDTSMPMSNAFQAILTDGKLVLKRYEPTNGVDLQSLFEALGYEFGEYDQDGSEYFKFHTNTYNENTKTLYASRMKPYVGNGMGEPTVLETHLVELAFEYDAATKEKMDAIINQLPDPQWVEDEYGGYHKPYYFKVTDLALVNYLVSVQQNDEYTTLLINYSTEFKELTGYRNFVLDTRMGTSDLLCVQAAGLAEFKYSGTVYGVKELGACADQVLYVPSDTVNDPQAMVAAAQQRIDAYIGEGKITLESCGTLRDYLVSEHGEDPDNIDLSMWTEVGYVTPDMTACKATINGVEWLFAVIRDSEKMTPIPSYKTVDFGTEVEVGALDTSIPLDTVIQVEQLTGGEEYDRIMDVLGDVDNMTYDIRLHSGSAQKYITKLENGKFEVKLPVPESWEGKTLTVYYVNALNEAEEHAVTISGGYAIFTTDHFSVYTLTEAKAADGQQKPLSPTTGDAFPFGVVAVVLVLVLTGVLLLAKKRAR